MYPDELDDYLKDPDWLHTDEPDPAALDAEEMEYDDWREHWVVLDGELVTR